MDYTPRLKRKYKEEVVKNLKPKYKSVMEVPRLIKICLNQGVNAVVDKKQLEAAQIEMTMIAGQKAVLTKSKKDISNFKLRKGMPVGVMVTLRGDRMYEFLDRFVTSALPRVRDFNGISIKGFDGRGNYTMGIKEQIAFPEISIDKINKVTGMDVTFVTSSNSDTEALMLLTELGLPFKQNDEAEKQREQQIEKKREQEKQKSLEESKKSTIKEEVVSEEEPKEEVVSEEEPKEEVVSEEEPKKENNNQDSAEEPGELEK